ncbi:MAG TPA: hypothetical protein VGS07_10625 [Thermoanaerobaculia bacterium]|jgi:hypothetical protein|nr:hypothetical protein [Thermoanaerobaculia bacterium]
MKRLLLVLLVCATAIVAAGKVSTVSADCLYERILYYSSPGGGLACGHTDFSCLDVVHTGCTTPYYTIHYGVCICP